MSTEPDYGPINSLASMAGYPSGNLEHVKAYMHQFGFGKGDYTEKQLSPDGINALRQMAAMNHGRLKSQYDDESPTRYPTGDMGLMLRSTLGRVAEDNVRRVNIGGIPYWQILDRYDFNAAKEDVASGKSFKLIKELMRDVVDGRFGNYDNKRVIPSLMGLGYNSNFLIPVDPARVAPANALEVYRQRTSLENNPAFPNNTLGGKVMRALTPAKHGEKVMP